MATLKFLLNQTARGTIEFARIEGVTDQQLFDLMTTLKIKSQDFIVVL